MEKSTTVLLVVMMLAGLFFWQNSESSRASNKLIIDPLSENFSRGESTKNISSKPNACGYVNYGLPDYTGTPLEGKTCADVKAEDQDKECILNTPLNYNGEIFIPDLYSNPQLSCCVADGTCQWK